MTVDYKKKKRKKRNQTLDTRIENRGPISSDTEHNSNRIATLKITPFLVNLCIKNLYIFLDLIFKDIAFFALDVSSTHDRWRAKDETRLSSDQMHNQSGCFPFSALQDAVSVHSAKE